MRQYIGARYVPKIEGVWTDDRTYEALSIVTYNGDSYTSKKPVPVGTLPTNSEYWALTGAYNSQLSTLAQEVDNLSERVDNLENRNFIVIGDSFSYGTINSETLGVGWAPKFKAMYEGYNLGHVYWDTDMTIPGVSGFASTRPFLNMLKDIERLYTYDNDSITDIVVLGGTNDSSYSDSAIETAIAEFCAYAHSNYPKARVAIGVVGTTIIANGVVPNAYSKCVKYGAEYIADTRNLMCDRQYNSDGTHITQAGYDFYSPYIFDAIMYGHCEYNFSIVAPITSDPVGTRIVFNVTERGYDIVFLSDYSGRTNLQGLLVVDALDATLTFSAPNIPRLSIENQFISTGTIYGFASASTGYLYFGNATAYISGTTLTVRIGKVTSLDDSAFSSYRIPLNDSHMNTAY